MNYEPNMNSRKIITSKKKRLPEGKRFFLEGPVGLEPTTPCLKGRCSNQLSYGPATLWSIQQQGYRVNLPLVFTAFFKPCRFGKQEINNRQHYPDTDDDTFVSDDLLVDCRTYTLQRYNMPQWIG